MVMKVWKVEMVLGDVKCCVKMVVFFFICLVSFDVLLCKSLCESVIVLGGLVVIFFVYVSVIVLIFFLIILFISLVW